MSDKAEMIKVAAPPCTKNCFGPCMNLFANVLHKCTAPCLPRKNDKSYPTKVL
jgi:hypothetical protein